eukprot:scaffold10280_cov64-Phaeocystis_antarctica.AAC.3
MKRSMSATLAATAAHSCSRSRRHRAVPTETLHSLRDGSRRCRARRPTPPSRPPVGAPLSRPRPTRVPGRASIDGPVLRLDAALHLARAHDEVGPIVGEVGDKEADLAGLRAAVVVVRHQHCEAGRREWSAARTHCRGGKRAREEVQPAARLRVVHALPLEVALVLDEPCRLHLTQQVTHVQVVHHCRPQRLPGLPRLLRAAPRHRGRQHLGDRVAAHLVDISLAPVRAAAPHPVDSQASDAAPHGQHDLVDEQRVRQEEGRASRPERQLEVDAHQPRRLEREAHVGSPAEARPRRREHLDWEAGLERVVCVEQHWHEEQTAEEQLEEPHRPPEAVQPRHRLELRVKRVPAPPGCLVACVAACVAAALARGCGRDKPSLLPQLLGAPFE